MTSILCLGDSLTDCGRLFDHPPYGNGYVSILYDSLISAGYAPSDFRITNCGVDGFTVSRLLENTPDFYLSQMADIVTILIGINDIGLMMNTCRTPSQQEAMEQRFSCNYERLIQMFASSGCRLILMEPFLFPSPDEYRTWIPHVQSMSRRIGILADKYHLPYVLLHRFLNDQAQKYGTDVLTSDGIHLTSYGHKILAEKLLAELQKALPSS